MYDTNIKGTITELKVLTYFLEHECMVSVPQSPCRYDFILEHKNNLYRVQTKTSRLNNTKECIIFSTESSRQVNGKCIHETYENDNIDYFCTMYEDECYLIPIEDCGRGEKKLRLCPTKNGQVKNIYFAKDYIAIDVLSRLNK